MLNYAVVQSQWKTHFHSLSDEELIEAFNQETQKQGWTTARTYLLKSLSIWKNLKIRYLKRVQIYIHRACISYCGAPLNKPEIF